jgi:hypothetical protein
MISYIEGPHEDEPLFSLLARIYGGLIGPSRSQFAQHLFGNPRLVMPFDFPCGIEALARSIGTRVGLTAEDLIQHHTMFPIAAFLMPAEHAERVKVAMRGNRAVAMNLLKWHRDPAQDGLRHLYFCAKCRDRDLRRFGHTWWRRIHQVPGVVCCPHHTEPLEVSQFVPGQFWKFDYPMADDAVSVRRAPRPDGMDVIYARDLRWMLCNRPQPIDPDRLRRLYHDQLDRLGLLRGGQLRRTDFLHQFYAQRSEHEWAQRHLHFDPDDPSAWPAQTVKNKANHRSFRMHLLVMRFLDLSIADIHTRLDALDDRPPVDSQRTEARLRALLRQRWFDRTWSMNALKVDLGIGIVRLLGLATKEGLPIPRLPNAERMKSFRIMRTRHRKTVCRGRSRVASTCWHTAVRWLGRNDYAWVRKRLSSQKRRRGDVVNWRAREEEYIGKLPHLASRIRAARPFRRVCSASFISLLPFGASMGVSMYKKMPRLAQEMRRQTETTEEFTLRRIRVVRQLNPDFPPYRVRDRATVARDCRDPMILRAMGYVLVGTRWKCPGAADHPLYGLAVATGPATDAAATGRAAG